LCDGPLGAVCSRRAVVATVKRRTPAGRRRNDADPDITKPLLSLTFDPEAPHITPIALAGLAALLVAVATSADEPTAQSAVAAETSKSDDQRSRSEGLIAKQYAQVRAEFEAEQAAHRPAATKPESTRDKGEGAAKASPDLVQILRDQAERLYEEVITEYGDIPYVTSVHRELEALLKEPAPQWNGKPLTNERRHSLEAQLARKRTLGQEAADRLDVMVNLAVGRPAPEIDGTDMDGKPLRLSDYKGKVVVLVFWGTWCGPCMALVPRERELVARLKDQPFALLGFDCKDDREAARKAMAREGMTWPSWYDGAAGPGPIAKRYHVRTYPSIFVIDAKEIIRVRQYFTVDQDLVDKLLEEMKRPTPPPLGAPPPASHER
jgi:thiol-disulfide isomerase/thioredoxin